MAPQPRDVLCVLTCRSDLRDCTSWDVRGPNDYYQLAYAAMNGGSIEPTHDLQYNLMLEQKQIEADKEIISDVK